MKAEDLIKLKDQLRIAEENKQRATGVLEQLQKELKEEWGCISYKDAQAELKRLRAAAKKSENALKVAVHDFEQALAEFDGKPF